MATVDTTLPAEPTGAAAEFAAAHSAEHDLKLYGGWFCPFVQRSWIVLHEKQIAHQYVEINPYHKAPEFLALNPRGLVPTLAVPPPPMTVSGTGKAKAKPLYESTIICEYLDEAYGDPTTHGPPLLPRGDGPADAHARARCRLWIDHVGGKIVPAFYRLLQHTAEKPYGIAEARAALVGHIKTFAAEMAEEDGGGEGAGPWFLGDRFSLVDVALAPWAMRLFLVDHYKPDGTGIPAEGTYADDEDEERVWRRWRVWFDAVTKRQSVRDTWSDDDMYVQAYRRYAEDTTQSEVGQATRKGQRLP